VATRVLIAHDSSDLALSGIAEALKALPNFQLVGGRIVSSRELESLLNAQPVDVIILVGADSSLDQLGQQLIGGTGQVTIVRLTIVPPCLRITPSIAQFGIAELVEMLQAIARTPARSLKARLIHGSLTATQTGRSDERPGSQSLESACAWLDALFKSQIATEQSRHGADLPGLTIGRDTAVSLLDRAGAAAAEKPEAALRWTAVESALAAERVSSPLAMLCDRLALSEIERKELLLCLAPELDIRYQRIFGYLHDDYGRRWPSFGLVCSLLGNPLAVRAELAAGNAFARWALTDASRGSTADEPLRLDRALRGWLLDDGSLFYGDPLLRRAARTAPAAFVAASPDDADRRRVGEHLESTSHGARILLSGADADGWRVRVESAALAIGAEPIFIDVSSLAGLDETELSELVARASRIVKIQSLVPVIEATNAEAELLARTAGPLLGKIATASAWPLFVIIDAPERSPAILSNAVAVLERSPVSGAERSRVLRDVTNAGGIALGDEEVERLAVTYSLTENDVALAVAFARSLAAGSGRSEPPAAMDIAAASRRIAAPSLPNFARRIEPSFELTQVVLPSDRRRQLDEIIAHVEHATTVFDKWRFGQQMPYGRGVTALFYGPPGTGKTMTAQAIAKALSRVVCHVDLAQVPSKYIGETNKNFETIFSEAEHSGAVVQIDEADAFFGKRSEIKDSHDRYANLEVAYLLQRIEAFTGLAILTTNFRQNLDPAFLRRFRFMIDFPLPDAAAREAIWRQCLTGAPLADDLDYRFLARRLELTGGNIRNVTLRAAFAAAAAGTDIAMRHIVEATRAELVKIGMHQAERELAERVA
jgi:AAA+ superfamily predicted ATPase